MENLTGGTPPVRYLPCVVPCKLYFIREEMKEHPEISVEEETIQKDLWDIEKQIKNIGHQVGEDISVMKSPHNKDSQ